MLTVYCIDSCIVMVDCIVLSKEFSPSTELGLQIASTESIVTGVTPIIAKSSLSSLGTLDVANGTIGLHFHFSSPCTHQSIQDPPICDSAINVSLYWSNFLIWEEL